VYKGRLSMTVQNHHVKQYKFQTNCLGAGFDRRLKVEKRLPGRQL